MCDVPPRTKDDFLTTTVEPLDATVGDPSAILAAMQRTSGAGRALSRAALIAEKMLRDADCVVFLSLSGPLVAAGLKHAILAMIDQEMVDAVVATGAILIDQDLLEAVGGRHFVGSRLVDDEELRALHLDRIGDVFVDGDARRELAAVVAEIADRLPAGTCSSREFLDAAGGWLVDAGYEGPSILRRCHEKRVPVFCPALVDSAAGPGLLVHRARSGGTGIALDGVQDFGELAHLKAGPGRRSGLLAVGGGTPKSIVLQSVAAAEVLGDGTSPHRYAVQLTVSTGHGGGRSGASFDEACSRGEVDPDYVETVVAEATLALPILVGALSRRRAAEGRLPRRLADCFQSR